MASAGGLLLGRSLPARASCSLGQLLMEGRSLAHVPGSARLQAWACAATPTTGSLQTTTSSSSSSSSCCALVDDASSTISRSECTCHLGGRDPQRIPTLTLSTCPNVHAGGLHLWTVPLAPRQSACARQGGGGRGGAVCPSAVSGGASGEVGPGGAAKAAGGKAASSSSSLPKGGKHKGGKPRPASPTVPPAASTSAGNGAPASATATLAASAPAAAASRGGAVVVDEAVEDGQQERDDAQEGGAFLASADVDPNQGQSLVSAEEQWRRGEKDYEAVSTPRKCHTLMATLGSCLWHGHHAGALHGRRREGASCAACTVSKDPSYPPLVWLACVARE